MQIDYNERIKNPCSSLTSTLAFPHETRLLIIVIGKRFSRPSISRETIDDRSSKGLDLVSDEAVCLAGDRVQRCA